ncbi:MAG TPA: AAA family ATPase [Ktedonobacteraceae bacterium]|nr:AAA family ATPase [Ktedonobacteraceae bacterium]
MDQNIPTLILISGLPATGKTTLARRVARQFALPMFAKDTLKEILGDTLGCADLAESKRLGRASMVLLYQFAETLLRAKQSCIIESFFYPDLATQDLLAMQQRQPFLPLQIHCSTTLPVILKRYQERFESGARHHVHMDRGHLPELDLAAQNNLLQPLSLKGPLIELDTTDFTALNYASLFTQIQCFLPQR